MREYKLRKEGGYVMECDRCGSPAPTVERDWDDLGTPTDRIPKDRKPKELLCLFCYETGIGTLLKYDHYREQKPLARALAQCFNVLLRTLDGAAKREGKDG